MVVIGIILDPIQSNRSGQHGIGDGKGIANGQSLRSQFRAQLSCQSLDFESLFFAQGLGDDKPRQITFNDGDATKYKQTADKNVNKQL